MKFDPAIGDNVRVCYDGKSGRAVQGVVVDKGQFAILVEFKEWAEDNPPVKCWFKRHTKQSFGGYCQSPDSLMGALFGTPGDWYSVYQDNV